MHSASTCRRTHLTMDAAGLCKSALGTLHQAFHCYVRICLPHHPMTGWILCWMDFYYSASFTMRTWWSLNLQTTSWWGLRSVGSQSQQDNGQSTCSWTCPMFYLQVCDIALPPGFKDRVVPPPLDFNDDNHSAPWFWGSLHLSTFWL